MGAFWIARRELISIVKEAAGYKSGLVLTTDDLRAVIPAEYEPLWKEEDDHAFRLRAEEFDDMFAQILYNLGASELPDGTPANIRMLAKYYHTNEFSLYQEVASSWLSFLADLRMGGKLAPGSTIDPEPIVREIGRNFGRRGQEILDEILSEWDRDTKRRFWSRLRRTEWKDMRELEDLFRSERLQSQHGRFFDQRFVDYLYANFKRIHAIHWRQFEGLTCAYFEREGDRVEIGPGRNDGGVDARIWHASDDLTHPPLILIQCKRQKATVDITTVKALYADIDDERASSGLIVTTSELAPGAVKLKTARGYPIEQADRAKLKDWIEAMRTKG